MPQGYKVDTDKAVGHTSPKQKVVYNRRDLMLYALAIGVKEDELKYLYELDPNFTYFPTYPLVLGLKGDTFDVNSYAKMSSGGGIPGVPKYDLNKLVHGEQSLEYMRPLPLEGEFYLQTKVSGIYDKGSGMVIERTTTMMDAQGQEYCKMTGQAFVIGYGGWNGPKGPKPETIPIPKRNPDHVDVYKTAPNQALLYRLSGDYNPLHADQSIAPKLGFKQAILHGLCSYGISAHAVLKAMGGNDPVRFKSIKARFAKPVYPGDTLETLMWKADQQPNADEEVIVFVTKAKERNEVVIANGTVVLKKQTSAKL